MGKVKAKIIKRGDKPIGRITAYEELHRGVRDDGATYFRFTEYRGNKRKRTLKGGYFTHEAAEVRASELHAKRKEERPREEAALQAAMAAQKGKTVGGLLRRWRAAVRAEAQRSKDRHVRLTDEPDSPTIRIRRKQLAQSKTEDKRATRGITSESTVSNLFSGADFVIELIGKEPVDEPDAAMDALIDRYVKKCSEEGRNMSQVALEHYTGNILRRAYLWGVAHGLVARAPEHPTVADKAAPESYARPKWTPKTNAEADLLLRQVFVAAAAGGEGRKRNEGGRPRPWGPAQVLLAAGSGARPIDLTRARVGGVDLKASTFVSIRKGGKRKVVPFHPNIGPVLKAWIDGRDPEEALFPVKARPPRRMPNDTDESFSRRSTPEARERKDAAALGARGTRLLMDAAARAGIVNEDGTPVRVTNYSLRRYVANCVVHITSTATYEAQMSHRKDQQDSYLEQNLDLQREALLTGLPSFDFIKEESSDRDSDTPQAISIAAARARRERALGK